MTESNVHRTRSSLRRILQSNAYQYFKSDSKPYLPIFITFTFRENIRELDTANHFFKKFIQRLNYFVNDVDTGGLKYIVVPEFQNRGAVHYHAIFFNLRYIEKIYDEMARIWGQGFVIVKPMNDLNHLVNYVSKYFTKEAMDTRLVGRKKYFCSKGLFKPKIFRDEVFRELFDELAQDGKKEVEFSYIQEYTNNEVLYRRYSGINPELSNYLT